LDLSSSRAKLQNSERPARLSALRLYETLFARYLRANSLLKPVEYLSTAFSILSTPNFRASLNSAINDGSRSLFAVQQAKTKGRCLNFIHSSARS